MKSRFESVFTGLGTIRERFLKINSQFKEKQKKDFDRYHGVHSLPPIPNDTDVWVNIDNGRQTELHHLG